MDKKDIEYLAATKANEELGNTKEGIALLSSPIEGNTVLTNYEKLIKAEEETYRDALTGLYNRRKFDEEIKELGIKHEEFSLLMIDVDDFKKVNDKYGHGGGDAALIHVSRVLSNNLNLALPKQEERDLLVRYGGDEFAVILKHVEDSEVAKEISERLQNSVAKANFKINGETVSLSISIGFGIIQKSEYWKNFVVRVDSALYHSKQYGNNTITNSDPNAGKYAK